MRHYSIMLHGVKYLYTVSLHEGEFILEFFICKQIEIAVGKKTGGARNVYAWFLSGKKKYK